MKNCEKIVRFKNTNVIIYKMVKYSCYNKKGEKKIKLLNCSIFTVEPVQPGICEMLKVINAECDHGSCTGNLKTGPLCACDTNWYGPRCELSNTPGNIMCILYYFTYKKWN